MMQQSCDSGELRPVFRSDLNMSVARREGQLVHLLEDPVTGRVFQVGVEESAFFLAMDGRQSLREYAEDDATELNQDQVTKLYQWGHAKSLWQDHSELAITRDRDEFQRCQQRRFTGWLNPISIQISLGCPADYLQRIGPHLQWLFSFSCVVAWAVTGLLACALIWSQFSSFANSTGSVLAEGGWVAMLVTWLVAKVLHETAHGIACQRYGVRVSDCGIILILLMPLAYVDVSGCNRLPSRWQRMVVSSAGIYVELWATFLAMIAWCYIDDPMVRGWLQAWIVTSGLTTLLFNANPLMKYDGYYVLSDWLDISNLATRGREQFWKIVGRVVLGLESEFEFGSSLRNWMVGVYGFLALIWRLLLTLTLVLAASAMFHGAGIVIAIVGGLFSVVTPLYLLVSKWKAGAYSNWRSKNAIISGAVAAVSLLLVFNVLTGPMWLSAPAIVQSTTESRVRAKASGFIRKVLVQTGEVVVAGQPLMILEDPELEIAVADLKLQIEQAKVRLRMHRQQGQFAAAESDQKELLGLQQTLNEKLGELENRIVLATRDGAIADPHVQQMVGKYVRRGQWLLNIDHPEKEITVSISQDDLPSVQRNFQQPVEVALTGYRVLPGQFASLVPNASLQVPADALATSNGGPLKVQPNTNSADLQLDNSGGTRADFRLTEPRFVATVRLPDSDESLAEGVTGQVYFKSVKRSLGAYWFISARQWLRGHLPKVL